MNSILTGIVSGLVVIFLAWIARTFLLARKLYLIQPKLFDYSDFVNANDSKTLEITVLNSGSRSEEDIQVQLSPSFIYTVLASNTAGLAVDDKGLLRIERLAPKQDSTVILTAEGGEFRKDHVIGVTSRETVGKIKTSLSDAQLTPLDNVLIPLVIFVLFPVLGYVVGNIVKEEIWPLVRTEDTQGTELKFKIENERIDHLSASKAVAKKYRDNFRVQRVSRNGPLVNIEVSLDNTTKDRLEYTFISTSPSSEERDAYPEAVGYVKQVLLFPGAHKKITVSDYLPTGVDPQLLGFETTVDGPSGRSVIKQDVVLLN